MLNFAAAFLVPAEKFRKIFIYRHTLWDMGWKLLKTKYANSILGIAWALVTPVLIMAAISFVFTGVFKTDIKDFPLFVLAGIMPWMFFSAVLNDSAISVIISAALLRQFNMPRELIPLSTVLSNFLNFLIGWVILYPLFIFHKPGVLVFVPLLSLCILMNVVFLAGVALALSALNVIYRDISQLLGVIIMFWFWITPIFYSVEMVPPQLKWVAALNPLTPFIVCYQDLAFYGRMPSVPLLLTVAGLALAALAAGAHIFRAYEDRLLKRI